MKRGEPLRFKVAAGTISDSIDLEGGIVKEGNCFSSHTEFQRMSLTRTQVTPYRIV